MTSVTHQTIRSLENIGILAANEKFDNAVIKAAESLRDLGIASVEKGNEEVAVNVARALERIGVTAAEQKLNEDTIIDITLSLLIVGRTAVEGNSDDVAPQVVESLGEISWAIAKNGFGFATMNTANHLSKLGMDIADKGLIKSLDKVVDSLLRTGSGAAKALPKSESRNKNYLEKAAVSAGFGLRDIAQIVINKKMKDIANKSVSSLIELTIIMGKNSLNISELIHCLAYILEDNKELVNKALKGKERQIEMAKKLKPFGMDVFETEPELESKILKSILKNLNI